jgi:hypothetical protein
MKTAMQELIDEVRKLRKNGFSVDDKYLQGLLEKEKEQIKKANMDGYKEGCTYHSFDHRPKTTEEYYNQTYNN